MDNTTLSEKKIQDQVTESYEEIRYKLPYSKMYHAWLFKKMIKLVQPKGKILDNGCGTGHLAEFLPNHEIIGIDISPEMIKKAKKRLKKAIVGDAENLLFKDNYFDTIFARGLLHHLNNPKQGVKEINRVLKPKGRVVFFDTLNSPISYYPRKIMRSTKHFSSTHKNFTRQEIENIINPSLKIIKVKYVGYIGYTLLGFPDILNIYKFFPFKKILTPLLIKTDEILGNTPLINRLALGIIILAEKSK